MNILSNKLEITFNRENIDRDFDIYMVSKEKGSYFYTNVLDRALIEHKAKSVVYGKSNHWYVMFGKNELDHMKFKSLLEEEEPDSIINKVDVLKEDSIYQNILTQLLFNTLAAPTRADMTFNNIGGNLYYFRDAFMQKYPKSFYALEVKVTYHSFLSLKVKTFTCLQNVYGKTKSPRFLFDDKSGRFRKRLSNDTVDESKLYVEKALNSKKKNTTPFLDFSSYEKFCNSRVGVCAEFMEDVKTCLSDYINVEFGGYKDYKSFSAEDHGFEVKEYGALLREKGVCILDEVKDEKSTMLLEHIRYELKEFYDVDCFCNRYLEGAYIIRIIHEEEYYENCGLRDPHQDVKFDDIVQHATIENFKLKSGDKVDAALRKVVQELIIKGDIMDKKLSTVNWNMLTRDIKFVKAKVYWKTEKDKKSKQYEYYRMTIHPTGDFEIDMYDSADFTEDEEWISIHETYTKYDVEWKDREVEGIVYYDFHNMNVIMRTEQTTLPNLFKLANALKLSDKENLVNVEIIKEALDEFKNLNGQYSGTEEVEKIDCLLQRCASDEIKIKAILAEVSIKKKVMEQFNAYLCQTRGILLHPTPKAAGIKEEYFNAVLDIKYFYSNNNLYYFVGTKDKALQQSLNNACILREVVATGEDLFLQDLFQLMAVEFVRNGQYTVVPFPFKYLNEVIGKYR